MIYYLYNYDFLATRLQIFTRNSYNCVRFFFWSDNIKKNVICRVPVAVCAAFAYSYENYLNVHIRGLTCSNQNSERILTGSAVLRFTRFTFLDDRRFAIRVFKNACHRVRILGRVLSDTIRSRGTNTIRRIRVACRTKNEIKYELKSSRRAFDIVA